jgi:Zn finger protein HypA/HybF involved in hydrogenase expression
MSEGECPWCGGELEYFYDEEYDADVWYCPSCGYRDVKFRNGDGFSCCPAYRSF